MAAKDGVPVLGYQLLMNDGLNGDFTIVYDGKKDPFTL